MKKCILSLMLFCHMTFAHALTTDVEKVKESLNQFVTSWNQGDITQAMDIYQNSNDALLISDKVIKGHDDIVKFWKDNYPNKADMGKMTFTDIEVKMLSNRYAMAVGKWTLESTKNTGGIFTVLFEKNKKGEWKSVVDHTTGL